MSAPPLRHWLLGLALSLLAAWVAGAFFLDTVQPVVFDTAVNRYVPAPGTSSRTRGEGWATSKVGGHGIRGLPGGDLPQGPKVVFWGDSFVEAVQVDDSERMAQVFTSLARRDALPLNGVGIGNGGDTLIDAVFRLPDYAGVLEPVALNVLVLSRLEDTLPDMPRPCRARFLSTPELRLERGDCPPSTLGLRLAGPFHSLELAGAFELYRKLQTLTVRLSPGPAPLTTRGNAPAPEIDQDAAFNFLLARTQELARGPVLLLRIPPVPALNQGRIVLAEPQPDLSRRIAQACARNGVGFLDLGPAFAARFQATGRFPRGFFNTPPGTGHLNQDGHRLVAEAVLNYTKEHRDALLAP
ncbi:MAG: hypothetical protein CVU73_06475 [Deltaproteobacteria bacterium HGW-Deltaproteobacteria-8]|jgi:lysophospholipase L1-like esterase|nr:MAG: hypothetical protein CVU73_06475 [Deltaproteobacteria bacterium HGW-Deltaproteobacteria-8]